MIRRGLTLIELLVALFLASLVAFFAWDLVGDEGRNYTKTKAKVKLQSDGKEAMRLLEAEMRNMGFNKILVAPAAASGVFPALNTTVVPCDVPSQDARLDPTGTTPDSSSFSYVDHNAVPGGDTIQFLFHQPQSGAGMTDCATDPLTSIAYRFNAGWIERQFLSGANAKSCVLPQGSGCNAPWVPMLDSVVSFNAEYGMIRRTSDDLYSTAVLGVNGNWTNTSLGITWSAGIGTISGFATASKFVQMNIPVDSFMPAQTYLISFRISATDSFLTSDGSPGTIAVGFLNASGTVSASDVDDTIRVFPGVVSGTFRQVDVLFNPASKHIGDRYFGLLGRVKKVYSGAGKEQQVLIRDLRVRRISRGSYFQWVSNPTPDQKAQIKAVRLSILLKSHRNNDEAFTGTFSAQNLGTNGVSWTPTGVATKFSYLLFQRIIPVVNNGN